MMINSLSMVNISTNLNKTSVTKSIEIAADGQGIRKESNSNSELISRVSKGSTVNLLSTDKGWAKVNYKGKVGYIDLAALKFNEK